MLTFFVLSALAADPPRYESPPADVAAILDAPRPPSVQLSPDDRWVLLLERPALPPIREVAAPVVKVAGVRIDPDTDGPARENPFTSVAIRRLDRPKDPPTPIAVEGRIRSATFDTASRRLMITTLHDDGIALWVADVGPKPAPRRLLGTRLAAAYGPPCDWLPGDEGIVCRVVPEGRGDVPAADAVPAGPRIEENLGRKTPARTYADLLVTARDEQLLDHWLTTEVVHVALDGTVTPVLEAALWAGVTPSPDGRWLLVTAVHRPYSHQVPLGAFPRKTELVERATGRRIEVADLPLADDVPITFGSVRTGRREVDWRPDLPATLWWVSALDGGDAGAPAPERDRLETWTAPFDGAPRALWTSELRFSDVTWGDAHTALVEEWWFAGRRTRTWRIDPSAPGKAPVVVWDRSYQDEYGHPGTPVLEPGPYGRKVLRRTPTGGLLLAGEGISPDGVHPFLDRFEWTKTTRVWEARDPYQERVVEVMDDLGREILTWRESQAEVPNLWRRKGRSAVPLTRFTDWAPTFASVRKEIVRYERADGLPLSATVYLPPGWDPERDGPRPAVFWVYPNEFEHRSDAGQVTAPSNTFDRPGGSSHLFLLLNGWIVVDDPVLPIVGDGDEQPNDTYVAQLVSGAEAAVSALVARKWIDPTRLVVGGHSYGAFTTANLLAHTDLFRAGIARSGAYNRTLTPFSFQGEERSFWEAPETYIAMSPFTVADRIDEPLLLIHGADDSNAGTWPVQSQRLYEALKGQGARVRWVELPAEDHGYRARESVGHVLWEMFRWAEQNTQPEEPTAAEGSPATE